MNKTTENIIEDLKKYFKIDIDYVESITLHITADELPRLTIVKLPKSEEQIAKESKDKT